MSESDRAGPSTPRTATHKTSDKIWSDQDISAPSSPRRAKDDDDSVSSNGRSSPYSTPRRAVIASPAKTKAYRSVVKRRDTPRRIPPAPPRPPRLPRPPSNPQLHQQSGIPSALLTTLSLLGSVIHYVISLLITFLQPFAPYIFLLLVSIALPLLLSRIPSWILRGLGYLLHRLTFNRLEALSWWPSALTPDSDIALAQGIALLPIRSLATPLCALTGLTCQLSFLSHTDTTGSCTRAARPFWRSEGRGLNIAGAARNLTKDVKGAKDIFESIAMLSDGRMMDRLEYVRYVRSIAYG